MKKQDDNNFGLKWTDEFLLEDTKKRAVIASLFVLLIIAPLYSGLAILLVIFIRSRLRLNRLWITGVSIILMVIAYLWYVNSDYGLFDIFGSLSIYLFMLCPLRLFTTSLTLLIFNHLGYVLNQSMEDWQLDREERVRDEALPEGEFDYDYTGHMLVVGTTGSGKTMFMNHVVDHNLMKDRFMMIVSGKLAGTDRYSLLEYARLRAEATGARLYVVSADPFNRQNAEYYYNPLGGLDWDTLVNILDNLITFTEDHYRANFVMWVSDIYTAVKMAGDELSLKKIIELYFYDDYLNYVRELLAEERITEEQKNELIRPRVQIHAEIAKESMARLEELVVHRDYLFAGEPISIQRAYQEKAVIYFDLNGNSAKKTTLALGAMLEGELQYVMAMADDPTVRKLIIADEISYYTTELLLPLFNLSRSAGFQMIAATQSFSDLNRISPDFADQIVENCNQYGIMRQNTAKNSEIAAETCGTIMAVELTKKIDGIDYESTGSQKVVDIMPAHPNLIRNLNVGEMVYLIKKDDPDGRHKTQVSLLKWTPDDLRRGPKPHKKKKRVQTT